MVIFNLEKKLNGKMPVNKLELLELISTHGRKNSFSIDNQLIEVCEASICYDLSKLDVSKIDDLSGVFRYSNFNGDISKWNLSNCKSISSIFANSEFNGDISEWDVSMVKNFKFAFSNSKFNQDISKWEIYNAETMQSMFAYGVFNKDIFNWDLSSIIARNKVYQDNPLHHMFEGNNNFELKYNNNKPFPKETNNILDWLFEQKRNLNLSLTKDQKFKEKLQGLRPIDNIEELIKIVSSWGRKKSFYSSFNGNFVRECKPTHCYPLDKLDISKLESLEMVFYGSPFNGDLSKWNVSKITNFQGTFGESEFNNDSLKDWKMFNAKLLSSMFSLSKFNGDLSKWDLGNAKDMTHMFAQSLFNGDISKWNVFNCKKMEEMFLEAKFKGNIFNWNFNPSANCKNIVKDNVNFAAEWNNKQHIDQSKSDSFLKFVKNYNKNIKNIDTPDQKLIDNKQTLNTFLKEKGIDKKSDLGKELIKIYNEKQESLKKQIEDAENLKKEVAKLAELDFFNK